MATAFGEAFQLRPVAVKNQVCKFHQLLKQLAFYIVIFSHGDTLVQCDVVLPNKDGPEALGRRARRTGPRDPLLLLGAVCGLDSSSPTATTALLETGYWQLSRHWVKRMAVRLQWDTLKVKRNRLNKS